MLEAESGIAFDGLLADVMSLAVQLNVEIEVNAGLIPVTPAVPPERVTVPRTICVLVNAVAEHVVVDPQS
jgi:thiamine monophosphate kinase